MSWSLVGLGRCTIVLMKPLLSLYFFIVATIQFGLLMGIFHYHRTQKMIRPSPYWMWSLTASVTALYIFGFGILGVDDIARPRFDFTVANTLFYVAAVLQLIFCLSLTREITKKIQLFSWLSIVCFAVLFEFMRWYGNFELRTIFMCLLASAFYIWQIYQLQFKKKNSPSPQLSYLQYASSGELLFALGRIIILIAVSLQLRNVAEIPQILIFFTIAQIVMNTLSYIAIGGYWAERIGVANAGTVMENERVLSLLQERDNLIASLLKANKSAVTGALSASIAHEINQPLGASMLNIQFLQKKLADGSLTPQLESEILNTLLLDNQRAAQIIRSLKTIFTDEKSIAQLVRVDELIESVLSIAKPEIVSKRIQIILDSDPTIELMVNRGELQQVLLNLINNAIQSLSQLEQAERHITIRSTHLGDGIEIAVLDNGRGVLPELQSQLFELFVSDKSSGMGLGLWLCNHIIGRHGGSIAYSDVAGGGAQFTIRFPKTSLAVGTSG